MENRSKYAELELFLKDEIDAKSLAEDLQILKQDYTDIVLGVFFGGEVDTSHFHMRTPDFIYNLNRLAEIFSNIAKQSN